MRALIGCKTLITRKKARTYVTDHTHEALHLARVHARGPVADTAIDNAAVARLAEAAGFVQTHVGAKQCWRLERAVWEQGWRPG